MCGIIGHIGPRARTLEGRMLAARNSMVHAVDALRAEQASAGAPI
jgi:hypothetical protein